MPVIAAAALVAGAGIASAQPLGAPLGPPADVAQVPNGDLSQGLAGWGTVGPAASMTLGDGPVLSATDNVTVLGPEVALPPEAQVIPVSLGAPGGSTVVSVRARLVGGGPEVPLTTIEPTRGAVTYDVPVTAVAGRTVRLVLDPTYTIGRRIILTGMGPVRAELPGWQVRTGSPVVGIVAGRQAIEVSTTPFGATTPPVTLTPGARALGVAVRGDGTVTASAGGRSVRMTSQGSGWTWLHAPVPGGATTPRMVVTATPATGGELALGPVGAPARLVAVAGISAGAGTVQVRVSPWARGLLVVARRGTTVVGRGRVGAAGVATLSVRGSGRTTVAVMGDARRAGLTRVVRVP